MDVAPHRSVREGTDFAGSPRFGLRGKCAVRGMTRASAAGESLRASATRALVSPAKARGQRPSFLRLYRCADSSRGERDSSSPSERRRIAATTRKKMTMRRPTNTAARTTLLIGFPPRYPRTLDTASDPKPVCGPYPPTPWDLTEAGDGRWDRGPAAQVGSRGATCVAGRLASGGSCSVRCKASISPQRSSARARRSGDDASRGRLLAQSSAMGAVTRRPPWHPRGRTRLANQTA
jgi:hypothetical protein